MTYTPGKGQHTSLQSDIILRSNILYSIRFTDYECKYFRKFFVLLSGRVADSYWKVHSWRKFHAGCWSVRKFYLESCPPCQMRQGSLGLQSKLYPSTLKIEHQCIVHNTSVLSSLPLRKRKRLANNDDLGLEISQRVSYIEAQAFFVGSLCFLFETFSFGGLQRSWSIQFWIPFVRKSIN